MLLKVIVRGKRRTGGGVDSLSTKATAYGRAWLPEGTGDGGRQVSIPPVMGHLPCPVLPGDPVRPFLLSCPLPALTWLGCPLFSSPNLRNSSRDPGHRNPACRAPSSREAPRGARDAFPCIAYMAMGPLLPEVLATQTTWYTKEPSLPGPSTGR